MLCPEQGDHIFGVYSTGSLHHICCRDLLVVSRTTSGSIFLFVKWVGSSFAVCECAQTTVHTWRENSVLLSIDLSYSCITGMDSSAFCSISLFENVKLAAASRRMERWAIDILYWHHITMWCVLYKLQTRSYCDASLPFPNVLNNLATHSERSKPSSHHVH